VGLTHILRRLPPGLLRLPTVLGAVVVSPGNHCHGVSKHATTSTDPALVHEAITPPDAARRQAGRAIR
jgi:hypothetical protein